jgi:hypothetical protein
MSERIVMALTNRVLLHLHLEAVWNIQLPPIVQNTIELQQGSLQPSWKLCAAEADGERITIWRPDVSTLEREILLLRIKEAESLPPEIHTIPGISHEVALYQTALPAISIETAQMIARPLTTNDQILVERFQPNSVAYYFHPDRQPLIGVINSGRLLSLAHSSRHTAEACELGIDTLPEARRRGYALAATVLWSTTVAQRGFVPLYSAFANNTASLKLATAAGYRTFAHATTVK